MKSHPSHVSLLLIALLAVGAHAEVYKWTDANGKVQFGDQPPAAAKAKPVKINKTAGPAAAPAPGGKPSTEKAEATAPVSVSEAEIRANCLKATESLSQMEIAGSVGRKDAQGRERDMNAAELKQAMEEARAAKKSWCDMLK
ncbi:DUF4124 domain-containing protein [Chitinimonas arctica]|uniref:DUF4124 domain-containing protein n=1 Tax=Chitinimonas arctica TaxID=2594795 RepID=A0A516SA71_9NEIS|nr:DUF4124 domain-containing protein [Chitinimonas arctica]QDQ25037.1 DUF4124 domain-containing protein [Chitinimonas arctica]